MAARFPADWREKTRGYAPSMLTQVCSSRVLVKNETALANVGMLALGTFIQPRAAIVLGMKLVATQTTIGVQISWDCFDHGSIHLSHVGAPFSFRSVVREYALRFSKRIKSLSHWEDDDWKADNFDLDQTMQGCPNLC